MYLGSPHVLNNWAPIEASELCGFTSEPQSVLLLFCVCALVQSPLSQSFQNPIPR